MTVNKATDDSAGLSRNERKRIRTPAVMYIIWVYGNPGSLIEDGLSLLNLNTPTTVSKGKIPNANPIYVRTCSNDPESVRIIAITDCRTIEFDGT